MQTFGWDTVFIVSISRINAALAANSTTLVMSFDAALDSAPPVSANGKFNTWEIVPGGDGKLLYLKLPIHEGLLIVGEEDTAREISLAGVAVVMSLELTLLPSYSGLDRGSGLQELKFLIDKVGYEQIPPAPGLITPVTVIDPSGRLSVADKALLSSLLANFLVENANQISYVFATINLVPPHSNSWLAPVSSDYAYLDKTGTGNGYLAILSVTDARDITHLHHTPDPDVIAASQTASFVISQDLFLKNVILPYLAAAYQTTPDSFYFDVQSHAIRNRHSFTTLAVKEGAITYYPQIDQLLIVTTTDGLGTTIEGSCSLYAGISMTYKIRTHNKAQFYPIDKAIAFLPDPKPQSSHHADIPWYYWFLGLLVKPIVDAVVEAIADGIAESLDNFAGQALSLAKNPPHSIQWTDTEPLDVTVAGVDGSFYMMGHV